MPTSHFRKIPSVVGIVDKLENVRSVLDVGAGFGKYGMIFREHLDIRKGRLDRDKWLVQIDAVEPSNVTLLSKAPYDNIYLEPIQDLLTSLGEYDLIIIADVLEYMEKSIGLEVLLNLYHSHCRQGIVVSFTPSKMRKFYPTQPEPKCNWHQNDFDHGFNRAEWKGTQLVWLFK